MGGPGPPDFKDGRAIAPATCSYITVYMHCSSEVKFWTFSDVQKKNGLSYISRMCFEAKAWPFSDIWTKKNVPQASHNSVFFQLSGYKNGLLNISKWVFLAKLCKFLVACKRLYNSLCRSAGRSVYHTFFRGALSSNSSETAWVFPTPFYRMNIDSPRMVYVYFHRPIYHRNFLWPFY